MRNLLVLGTLAGLALAPQLASASTWTTDPDHTEVGFSVRHMMISDVTGRFKTANATIQLDDKDATKSKVEVEVDVASIDTRNAKRDDHLRSADFFDAAKMPKMTFKSTSIKKAGKGFKVTGDLTIRGITKPVTLDVSTLTNTVKDPWGMNRRAAVATAKISRKDFGLNWNKALETGGVLVGDEVTITISTELIEKVDVKS
ncbi:MAG: YceI family protein [Deltaproteobacteria bacterium]|nr:YceI family protein [Deltaproteobacteria bacterium]